MYAGSAKKVSIVLGFERKMVLGRNSPVNSTTSVESSVSHVTLMPSDNGANKVASKMRANSMP